MRILLLLCLLTLSCSTSPPAGSYTPSHLAGFGDSITAEWERRGSSNASWLRFLSIPNSIERKNRGLSKATCPLVHQWMWIPVINELESGDIVVVMCHTPDFEVTSLVDALDAVLEMYEEAQQRGLRFVFATQPAWHTSRESEHPDSRRFYDVVRASLPEVVFIDNDRTWKHRRYNERAELYSDGIHLLPAGAEILGRDISAVLCREMLDCR